MKLLLAFVLASSLTGCAFGIIPKEDGTSIYCAAIGHAKCKSCDSKDNCDSIEGGYGSADLYAFLAGVATGIVTYLTAS